MTDFNPNSHSMYLALQDFYPIISLSKVFIGNLFMAFEAEVYQDGVGRGMWAEDFHKWLPSKTGLLRDPSDTDYHKFRVVDEKLYSFALLKYS